MQPREKAIEEALSWANQQGYALAVRALDAYCEARGLTWDSDPMYNYVKFSQ